MISLDLSRVTQNATLVSVLMTCASAWMESALLDPNGGQRWVVYDEAWRLMSHPALLRRMDALEQRDRTATVGERPDRGVDDLRRDLEQQRRELDQQRRQLDAVERQLRSLERR